LVTTPDQERELAIRMEMARQIYNAALEESLRILDLMRESRAWKQARKLKGKDRTAAFKAAVQSFGFNIGTIYLFTKTCRKSCCIQDHVGAVEAQTLSDRAFSAVQRYGFGKQGRPRFKGYGRLHSVEGKSNKCAIMLRGNQILWIGLTLSLMLDPKSNEWQTQALACRTKYCRIVRRRIKGQDRWFCQLVQEGRPPQVHQVGEGSVGLDIGPSTIAVVSDSAAKVQQFCPTVQEPWAETRVIQRALRRSRKATNPNRYNSDGTYQRGRGHWTKSTRYRKLQVRLVEQQRKLSAERRRAHGQLCNEILAQGKELKTENISYLAFQKNFGRSMKVRAPGMFMALLTRKAENAGGSITLITPRTTKLSQYDHTVDRYIKKPLSQRIHCFGDGVTKPVQRDLYSAFLAKHCSKDNLDVRQVQLAWPAAKPLLRRATSKWKESASRKASAIPHDHDRQSGSSVKADPDHDEARDVVVRTPDSREPGRAAVRKAESHV